MSATANLFNADRPGEVLAAAAHPSQPGHTVMSDPSPRHTLPQMLSVAEVAEIFGRAPRTIRSWIARGLFQPVKVGHAVFIPETQIGTMLTASQPVSSDCDGCR